MTKQVIYYGKASAIAKDSFYRHIKNALLPQKISHSNFTLSSLHKFFNKNQSLLKKGTDQTTLFHKAIYSTFDKPNFFKSEFYINYKELALEILKKLKKETGETGSWAVQRFPTLRFQLPDNVSVFEFHRDSDYDHPLGEINCFYALNECYKSSALQVEKNLGFEDYVPINLKSGEYALLNTSIYKHGDILNKTSKTRVSMDFRLIPERLLDNKKASLTKGMKFNTDCYFIKEKEMKDLK